MTNLDRKRLLAIASIKKDFGDLFMLLPLSGGISVALIYACIFQNAYNSLIKSPLIVTIFACSVTLSIAIVFLWNRTPKIHLLGAVIPKWQSSVTHALRKDGYNLINSNAHRISFSKGDKRWFNVMFTECIVIEDSGMLYAFVWKGTTKIHRDLLYSGKSEVWKIQTILYSNNKSQSGNSITAAKWQNQAGEDVILKMEFLHANNLVEDLFVSEQDAVTRNQSFQWDFELSQAESLKLVSPTVSLEYPEKKHVFWASIIQKIGDDFEFLVCLQRRDKTSGRKKLSGSQYRDIEIAHADEISISELPGLFHLFYAGEFETLAKKIGER